MEANRISKPVSKRHLIEILAEVTIFQAIDIPTSCVFIVTKHIQQRICGPLSLLTVIKVKVQDMPEGSFQEMMPVGHPKWHMHVQVSEMPKNVGDMVALHRFAP